MQTWEEFTRRFRTGFTIHSGDFYAVIDPDGYWIDSSTDFVTCLHWVSMAAGTYDPERTDQENLQATSKLGYSIVHARFLKVLWESGQVRQTSKPGMAE